MTTHTLSINETRLLGDLDDLARLGATPDGGVDRPALSEPDLAARRWFQQRAEAAGLRFHQDAALNVFAALPSEASLAGPAVLFGSHLDTVRHGGRYDGALGVVAALEVLRTISEHARDAGLFPLPCPLEVVSFTDEEGSWRSLLGSRAFTGQLTAAELAAPRGMAGSFAQVLDRAGLDPAQVHLARRPPGSVRAWVEAHIEQGPRLEAAGLPVGVVSGIVGIASYWLTFHGRADHAGTAPLDRRRNALLGASRFVLEAHQFVRQRFPGATLNCGRIEALPGAFNVVPGEVRLALEFRHSQAEVFAGMAAPLCDLAGSIAAAEALTLDITPLDTHPPVLLDSAVMAAIEAAAAGLGLACTRLPSFAGHDTQVVAALAPAGMFFVPSRAGLSHNPAEYTPPQDCINAANLLLHTVLRLAGVAVG